MQIPKNIKVFSAAGKRAAFLSPKSDELKDCYSDIRLNGESKLEFLLPATSPKIEEIAPECTIWAGNRVYSLLKDDAIDSVMDKSGKVWMKFMAEERWAELDTSYIEPYLSNDPSTPVPADLAIIIVGGGTNLSGGLYTVGTAAHALYAVLQGSGWSMGTVDVSGIHDLEMEKVSRLQHIKEIQNIWGGYLVWDSVNKMVHLRDGGLWQIYRSFQLRYAKNMQDITRTQSNRIFTKMYGFGKDNLDFASVNEGIKSVTNNSFTPREYIDIFSDPDIEDAQELKEKTIANLALVCRPRYNYKAKIVDMRTKPEYSHEEFELGDMADIINKKLDIVDRVRIIRHKYNLFQPWDCELELGDPEERLVEKLKASFDTSGFIENKFNSSGYMSGSNLIDWSITQRQLSDAAVTTRAIANLAVDVNKLADLSVTVAKIVDGSITMPKLGDASVSTAKLQDVAITTEKIANLAVDANKLAALSVTAAKIASGAVDLTVHVSGLLPNSNLAQIADATKIADGILASAKFADGSVTNAKLANLAVDAAKLAGSAVTAEKIANLAVGTAAIANLAVGSAQIADLAVSTAKIGDLAVSTAKIYDGAITNAKIGTAAVATANIQDAAINSAKIGEAAVGSAAIANAAIGTAHIANAAITTALIQDAAIVRAKIQDLAVDSAKIADAAITSLKVAEGAIGAAAIGTAAIGSVHIGTGVILTAHVGDAQITDAKIASLTANKITAGIIDATVVTIQNLVVGTNVTMGPNATIAYSQVTGTPDIPVVPGYIKSTYIDSVSIQSPTIIGGEVIGDTFKVTNDLYIGNKTDINPKSIIFFSDITTGDANIGSYNGQMIINATEGLSLYNNNGGILLSTNYNIIFSVTDIHGLGSASGIFVGDAVPNNKVATQGWVQNNVIARFL